MNGRGAAEVAPVAIIRYKIIYFVFVAPGSHTHMHRKCDPATMTELVVYLFRPVKSSYIILYICVAAVGNNNNNENYYDDNDNIKRILLSWLVMTQLFLPNRAQTLVSACAYIIRRRYCRIILSFLSHATR